MKRLFMLWIAFLTTGWAFGAETPPIANEEGVPGILYQIEFDGRLIEELNFRPNPGVTIEKGVFLLPNPHGWKYFGQKKKDYFKEIPGEETVLETFQKDDLYYFVAFLNKEPFVFWYHDPKAKRDFGQRADYNKNGNFEQNVENGALKINFGIYGIRLK